MKIKVESQCRAIYKEAFCEENAFFEDMLFESCFRYIRYIKFDGKIAAMLFALPCRIITESDDFEGFYVYAAATLKSERGKGHMTRLINELKKEGKAIFLRPADEGLVEFYKKLGFSEVEGVGCDCGCPQALPQVGFRELAEKLQIKADGSSFPIMVSQFETDIAKLNFPYSME